MTISVVSHAPRHVGIDVAMHVLHHVVMCVLDVAACVTHHARPSVKTPLDMHVSRQVPWQSRWLVLVVRMVKRLRMKFMSPIIHVKDAHSHVSIIPIRRQIVGMLDAWVDASRHATLHVQHHALVDVWITKLNPVMDIRVVKVKDVQLGAHSTALVYALEYVKDIVLKHVGRDASSHVVTTVHGHVIHTVVLDVKTHVQLDVLDARVVLDTVLVKLIALHVKDAMVKPVVHPSVRMIASPVALDLDVNLSVVSILEDHVVQIAA